MNASSVGITKRDGGATEEVGYLAMEFDDMSVEIGTLTTPTSEGVQTVSGLSFTPGILILGFSNMEALATGYDNNLAGTIGSGVATVNGSSSVSISSEDANLTMNNQSLSEQLLASVPEDDGSTQSEAELSGFGSGSFSINHTSVASSGKLWWYCAIG
jgi:hypothetical protein